MDEGFLGVESNAMTPPSWFRKKSITGFGGEKIASGWSLSGMKYLEAHRCQGCRNITIKY